VAERVREAERKASLAQDAKAQAQDAQAKAERRAEHLQAEHDLLLQRLARTQEDAEQQTTPNMALQPRNSARHLNSPAARFVHTLHVFPGESQGVQSSMEEL